MRAIPHSPHQIYDLGFTSLAHSLSLIQPPRNSNQQRSFSLLSLTHPHRASSEANRPSRASSEVNRASSSQISKQILHSRIPRRRLTVGSAFLTRLGRISVALLRKKFQFAVLGGSATPDIASKIMAFSQQGPRTVCILSANGAISNVTLRQPSMSGGTVTYEGRYEIISLSGSFFMSESNGNRSRTGGLSVSLAGSDGRVLGGGVAGMLVAATPVQVIVGSFIADGKKSKSGQPSTPMSNILNFGAPVPAASPPSQGPSSDSSDYNGGSPFNRVSGPYNNTSQPVHSMSMYSNMSWGNSI
ncbi:AT hook motif DNA-binding family protein [Actinidia rufa]|uniref:AT-hook motif nuclear-localized protein n=1 Tax=Actinidia rufa TaxID=165716 RepID=A0A7J0H231_9ERIC|nr:AT hook motif DNA-binding family protein [Actinidia rufa]